MKKSLVTGLITLGLAAVLVGCGSSDKTVIDEIEYSYYGLETDSFTDYLDEKDLLYKSDFDIYNMVADDFLGHRAYYVMNPYYMDIYITADDDNELTNASKDVKKYLEKNQDKKFYKSELGEYMDYNGEVAWVYLFYRNQDGYSSYRDFYDENNGLGKVYVTEYKDIKSKKNKEFNFKAIAYNVDTNLLDIQNEYPNILGNINTYIKLRVIGYKDMHMYPLFSEYDSSIEPPVYDENALYGGVDSAASDDADGGALENDEVALSNLDSYSRLCNILKSPSKVTDEVLKSIGLETKNAQYGPGFNREYQVEDDSDEYLPPNIGRAAAQISYETLIPQNGTTETIVNIDEFIRLTEDSKKRLLDDLFEIANIAAQYGECQSVDNDSKGEFVGISNDDVKKLYDNLLCYEEIKKILEGINIAGVSEGKTIEENNAYELLSECINNWNEIERNAFRYSYGYIGEFPAVFAIEPESGYRVKLLYVADGKVMCGNLGNWNDEVWSYKTCEVCYNPKTHRIVFEQTDMYSDMVCKVEIMSDGSARLVDGYREDNEEKIYKLTELVKLTDEPEWDGTCSLWYEFKSESDGRGTRDDVWKMYEEFGIDAIQIGVYNHDTDFMAIELFDTFDEAYFANPNGCSTGFLIQEAGFSAPG